MAPRLPAYPGYDRRPRRQIGTTVDTLPDLLNGIQRVQGWLEVAARNGIVIPPGKLKRLRDTCALLVEHYNKE